MFKRFLSTSKEIYFGTNSINRHSFLRADPIFIANSITSPHSKYIFFKNLEPIVDVNANKLFTLDYETIGSENRDLIDDWIKSNSEKSSNLINSPIIHFLGLNQQNFSPFKYNQYTGTPFYAIDITHHDSFNTKIFKTDNIKPLETRELVNKHLDYYEANVFAQAKMYLEWISSTRYCKGCGSKTIPVNAGSELKCTSSEDLNCPVKTAPVSNASFPRLDPVLISCVLNPSKDKVLLTRMSKFPKGMYTHIAGFIEPGETIENAVKREVWEESGLKVSQVQIVQSQPWPYPVNIMIGCVAIIDDVNLNLEHDMELEDALWLDIKKVREIVYEGKEDEDLTLFKEGCKYGIPNDKTLATKLFQYVVDNY